MRKVALAAMALLMIFPTAQPMLADGGSEIRLRTPLSGGAINGVVPKGQADFRSRPGDTRLEIEVQHVNLAGQVLTVCVDTGSGPVSVGTITVNSFLTGQLELESQHGAAVPAVAKGTIVTVKDPSNAVILTGVF